MVIDLPGFGRIVTNRDPAETRNQMTYQMIRFNGPFLLGECSRREGFRRFESWGYDRVQRKWVGFDLLVLPHIERHLPSARLIQPERVNPWYYAHLRDYTPPIIEVSENDLVMAVLLGEIVRDP